MAAVEIPISEQHAFLDLAKAFEWDTLKHRIDMNPALVSVQPSGREGALRWSALHQAAYGGSADMVNYLLRKHAVPEALTSDGKTPLEVAKTAEVKAILRTFMSTPEVHRLMSDPGVGKLSKSPKRTKKLVKHSKASVMKVAKAKKKVKKVNKTVAKGKRAKALVYSGRYVRTSGGLKKETLAKNKKGKIVSARKQAFSKIVGFNNIRRWLQAFKTAREELGINGFVPVKKGSALYAATRKTYDSPSRS